MNTSEIRKENLINLYNEKGEKHGYWDCYYCNGQSSKGKYVNGKRDGYWEEYCSNGKLEYTGNYVNGNRHGYFKYYYSNGQLFSKGKYVNGNRHGYWEEYCSNGKLEYKGYYDMGKQVDYNPEEPKIVELTLSDIANKFGIDINQLRIKE